MTFNKRRMNTLLYAVFQIPLDLSYKYMFI